MPVKQLGAGRCPLFPTCRRQSAAHPLPPAFHRAGHLQAKGEESTTNAKRTMHLTDDNWADYFSDEYPASLVEGFTVDEDGIDRDDPIVTKLLAWVARESGRSKEARYDMTRHDAAFLLEHMAG